jgi:hypothetical protein
MDQAAWPTRPAPPETNREQGEEGAQQQHGRSLAAVGADSLANAGSYRE